MSNKKSPRSPVERGIFLFPVFYSLFPVYVLFSPVFRRSPISSFSSFSSPSISPSISPALYAGIFCMSFPPDCIRLLPSGIRTLSIAPELNSGIFVVYCAGCHPASSPLPLFLFCCLPAVLFLFLGCLSAIFYIFLYFSIFFYIFICIYQKIVVPLHRLSEWTDMTYCIFAFAIYWTFRNVGSFKMTPIISRQTSIVYIWA